MRKLFCLLMGCAFTAFSQPTPKTFFAQLLTQQRDPTQQEVQAVTNQIPNLSKQDALDLVPVVLSVLKSNQTDRSLDACLALFVLSMRPDSGEILKLHHADLLALYGRNDSRYIGTANAVLTNLKPPPPELIPQLTALIVGPGLSDETKVSILGVIVHMDEFLGPKPAPQTEAIALRVLAMPLTPAAHAVALTAVGRLLPHSPKLTTIAAADLKSKDVGVQLSAIESMNRLGRNGWAPYANDIAQIAAGSLAASAGAKTLAKAMMDGKEWPPCLNVNGDKLPPGHPCNNQ
jgi:hypothetical protein